MSRVDRVEVFVENGNRVLDEVARRLVRLVPKRVRYWCLIDAGVRAIYPWEEVPAVPFTEVLKRQYLPEVKGLKPFWHPINEAPSAVQE